MDRGDADNERSSDADGNEAKPCEKYGDEDCRDREAKVGKVRGQVSASLSFRPKGRGARRRRFRQRKDKRGAPEERPEATQADRAGSRPLRPCPCPCLSILRGRACVQSLCCWGEARWMTTSAAGSRTSHRRKGAGRRLAGGRRARLSTWGDVELGSFSSCERTSESAEGEDEGRMKKKRARRGILAEG